VLTTHAVLCSLQVPASWIGIGREEDAAQSVFRLVPRPLMEDSKRRLAQDGLVLRFMTHLVLPPNYPAHMIQDAERRWATTHTCMRSTASPHLGTLPAVPAHISVMLCFICSGVAGSPLTGVL
jgi:hypothetical protein